MIAMHRWLFSKLSEAWGWITRVLRLIVWTLIRVILFVLIATQLLVTALKHFIEKLGIIGQVVNVGITTIEVILTIGLSFLLFIVIQTALILLGPEDPVDAPPVREHQHEEGEEVEEEDDEEGNDGNRLIDEDDGAVYEVEEWIIEEEEEDEGEEDYDGPAIQDELLFQLLRVKIAERILQNRLLNSMKRKSHTKYI